MTEECCGKCRFWYKPPYPDDGNPGYPPEGDGYCRRHAPTMFELGKHLSTLFPIMPPHMWCGEFDAKENDYIDILRQAQMLVDSSTASREIEEKIKQYEDMKK